ncbi:hypothetical protein EV09_0482 [Prochlorococcus marinus str. SS35]|nr:hypothetical protein EV09_0482 [Prochlorococcus marinus str. SS35]
MHGGNLFKDISCNQLDKGLAKDELTLPLLSGIDESTLSKGQILNVDGTNVVRVPFGVRHPRRKRPQIPERLATLILPFQRIGSPTPPPHAA